MRVLIVGILVLTLGVAGVSTYLIGVFSTPDKIEELEKQAKIKVFRVLIAAKDLKTGTDVKDDMLAWQVWPEKNLNPLFIAVSDDDKLAEEKKKRIGSLVRRAMNAGEPVLEKKLFKRDEPGYMAGMLSPGMRAVPISVNQITGAAGFIFPGDFVDVVLTHNKLKEVINKRVPKDRKLPLTVLTTATETILQKIRVLAIGQKVDQFEKKALVVPTVTLEMSPKQAEMLATARSMGRMSLVLRSLEEAEAKPGAKRTYTTDVEVSPFMRNFDEIIQRLLPPAGPTKAEVERDTLKKQLSSVKQALDSSKASADDLETRLQSEQQQRSELESLLQSEQRRTEETQKDYEARLEAAAERRRLAEAAESSKPVVKTAAPVKPKKKEKVTIKIYRGGSQKTQEVTIK